MRRSVAFGMAIVALIVGFGGGYWLRGGASGSTGSLQENNKPLAVNPDPVLQGKYVGGNLLRVEGDSIFVDSIPNSSIKTTSETLFFLKGEASSLSQLKAGMSLMVELEDAIESKKDRVAVRIDFSKPESEGMEGGAAVAPPALDPSKDPKNTPPPVVLDPNKAVE